MQQSFLVAVVLDEVPVVVVVPAVLRLGKWRQFGHGIDAVVVEGKEGWRY